MKTIHNHKSKIDDLQPATLKSVMPGMILTFKYNGAKVSDKNPMILFLHYDSEYGLIEGLNLNYLSSYKLKSLFEGFKDRTSVQDMPEETSGLISEDFTFITVPPTTKMSRPASRSEAKVEMKRMYKKFVGPKFSCIYRSYSPSNIKTLKIVNLKDY